MMTMMMMMMKAFHLYNEATLLSDDSSAGKQRSLFELGITFLLFSAKILASPLNNKFYYSVNSRSRFWFHPRLPAFGTLVEIFRFAKMYFFLMDETFSRAPGCAGSRCGDGTFLFGADKNWINKVGV